MKTIFILQLLGLLTWHYQAWGGEEMSFNFNEKDKSTILNGIRILNQDKLPNDHWKSIKMQHRPLNTSIIVLQNKDIRITYNLKYQKIQDMIDWSKMKNKPVVVTTLRQSRDSILPLAEDYAKQIGWFPKDELKVENLEYDEKHSKEWKIRWRRYLNNIPFEDEYIIISIEDQTGKMIFYSNSLRDPLQTIDQTKNISESRAVDIADFIATRQFVKERHEYAYKQIRKSIELKCVPTEKKVRIIDDKAQVLEEGIKEAEQKSRLAYCVLYVHHTEDGKDPLGSLAFYVCVDVVTGEAIGDRGWQVEKLLP